MSDVLLINPWVHDFAAYDLWSKPLGLLYLADLLRKNNISMQLLDCMDRRREVSRKKIKLTHWKTGRYNREIIAKPEVYKNIPRHYARYGISYESVEEYLSSLPAPKLIAITSGMTYWYPGIIEMVDLCRKRFPKTPIILGGVYATLTPDHALENASPDYLARGPLCREHMAFIANILSREMNFFEWHELSPVWELYPELDYLVLNTSKGCPYGCDFCASDLISGAYCRRPVDEVVNEIKTNIKKSPVTDIAFYDDALFLHKDEFIKPILKKIIDCNLDIRFHTPNGVHSRMIDKELAALLYKAKFASLRLSFETSAPDFADRMNKKVNKREFYAAFENLLNAGFKPGQLRVYLLAGLPGQSWQDVLKDVEMIHNIGAQISLNAWSPIPGTKDYERALADGLIQNPPEPLLSNPSCLPNLPVGANYNVFIQLLTLIKEKNFQLRQS